MIARFPPSCELEGIVRNFSRELDHFELLHQIAPRKIGEDTQVAVVKYTHVRGNPQTITDQMEMNEFFHYPINKAFERVAEKYGALIE